MFPDIVPIVNPIDGPSSNTRRRFEIASWSDGYFTKSAFSLYARALPLIVRFAYEQRPSFLIPRDPGGEGRCNLRREKSGEVCVAKT